MPRYNHNARLLRERKLQVQYGLSIQESVIVAALEAGNVTQAELARDLGITRQALATALKSANGKMAPKAT